MKEKSVVVNFLGRKGGGAVYSYEMAKSLIENGCEVYAIIAKDIENLKSWQTLQLKRLFLITTYSNRINFVINTIFFKLVRLTKLKKEFKNINIDAIYTPMISPWARFVNSIFIDCQKIVTVHDPKLHDNQKDFFNIDRKSAIEADDIIILSEIFRTYSELTFKKTKEHVHVIPLGVFNYYKEFEKGKSKVIYDPNKINFLFFGRISKYKGLHILAKAYEKLFNESTDISLTVAGNGDFSEYEDEFNNLKNTTIFNQWISDEEVSNFFNGKNIVTVLPYTNATQSGVISIAMTYRSLVIATQTGGLPEQIQHKRTGYLCEPNNIEALYSLMKYVILHYDDQNEIITNAFQYINSLSWNIFGKQLYDIIN
jgi:Glycosyltransferase